MLTESEIDIIRSSAEKMAELNVIATNMFYANLFKEVPEIRVLFPDEMFEQSEKLWASIVMVVESVDDLTDIVPALKELGARHVGYGAEPDHYIIVSRVLIETIASLMADDWTKAHQDTWTKAMDIVVETMLSGASRRAA
ncbi:MAG: globin domain-containing protein [Pseudomonadota bacterium]